MFAEHFDLALISLYAFWLFFAGLIYYLRREDRREGYPLELDVPGRYKNHGLIWIPAPKTFNLPHGGTKSAPDRIADTRTIPGQPIEPWPGAPLEPTGASPMTDGIGPSSYALRADEPDLTTEGTAKIAPMRVLSDFVVVKRDGDPRGYDVIGSDRIRAGTVIDLWVDRSECLIRYLEVEVPDASASTVVTPDNDGEDTQEVATPIARTRRVLLPMPLATVNRRRKRIEVTCVLAEQFQQAPSTRASDQVTMLEEDKVSAFFASGYMFSRPRNREPFL